MAIILPPIAPAFKTSQFGIEYSTAMLESPFTREQQVIERSGARWRGTFSLPPMNKTQAAEWQAWLAAMKGQVNTFMAYDPDARTPRGSVPLAPFGFNQTRNGNGINGTVGTLGSGGVLPTFWSHTYTGTGNAAAMVFAVEAINQVINGVRGVRIRLTGTPAANGNLFIYTEQPTITDAAVGQIWTHSYYAALLAGSAANTSVRSWVRENTIGGGFLAEGTGANFGAALTTDPLQTRVLLTRTLANASVVKTSGGIAFGLTAGQPVDITLFVGASQLEQRNQASPYIETAGAIAFRSDGVRVFGANQTGTQVVVRGFTANAQGVLLAGDYINIGTGLYMVAENAASDYRGVATLKLTNPLKGAPVNDSAIVTSNAAVEMRLVDDGQAIWEANEMGVYGIKFSAVEALS